MWVALAPGAAHRSSTRSPGCGSTACATSWEARLWPIASPRAHDIESSSAKLPGTT